MSYVTPVKNHTATSYFNVADWTRVYGNSRLASFLAAIMLDEAIAFTAVTAPTVATNPSTILSMVNSLCANIEAARLAMAALLPALTEVKDDWTAGQAATPPNYSHVNQWETTIDAIWDYYDGDNLEVCPDLAANLVVGTGEVQIFVGCVNTNGYDITINDTGVMHVI